MPIYFPIFINYAEIHYRFPFLVSYLKKDEPEILADAPFRVEPDQPIPLFYLIKDADQYPIILDKIIIEMQDYSGNSWREVLNYEQRQITEDFWYKVHFFRQGDLHGIVTINVSFFYTRKGRRRKCKNDNYRTASHRPLKVYLAEDPLPALKGWHYGDAHYHSDFTNDHVEFGAPLDVTAYVARALGLTWFAVTDHSYDVDDLPYNYLKNDPDLQKWKKFQKLVADWNWRHSDMIIISGEEVSCGNHRGENVHLLGLGISDFIPGKGDSAEIWLENKPDLTIPEVLDRIEANNGIAFGAHVGDQASFLEQKLLGRGNWHIRDGLYENCAGLQIWNGRDFKQGRKLWIDLLLQGKRAVCIAGNDAHGNFNRYRQIGIPFLKIAEGDWQKFGDVRTAVYCEKLTLENILTALKNGNSFVTNGPFGKILVVDINEDIYSMGTLVPTKPNYLTALAKSTSEFGAIQSVILFSGDLEAKEEAIWKKWSLSSYWWKFDIPLKSFSGNYVRMEIESANSTKKFHCFTNPIWLENLEDE